MEKIKLGLIMSILFLVLVAAPSIQIANATPGEATYERLTNAAKGKTDSVLLEKLNLEARKLQWGDASESEFVGNLRIINTKGEGSSQEGSGVYLVRKLTGELLILSVPENIDQVDSKSEKVYIDY